MKKCSPYFVSFLILFAIFIIFTIFVQAQPNPDGDPDAPIDGGLSLLVAAGIGYGVKKHRDYRKSKNANLL